MAALCLAGLGGCGARRSGGGGDGDDDDDATAGHDADAGGAPDGSSPSGWGSPDAGAEDPGPDAAAAPDPDVEPPIPERCNDREVMFREWSVDATGDGTYFADQAPWRLGFSRVQGRIWIVELQTEENTYLGRASAYGDSSSGVMWISDDPCDPTHAVEENLISFGGHGGGTVDFLVVRDDADALTVQTDPAYEGYRGWPVLRGGHRYYAVFENTDWSPPNPIDVAWLTTTPDTCGEETEPAGSCYYLAFDMGHLLHVPTTGQVVAGNVIAGLTHL